MHVADADSIAKNLRHTVLRNPHAIVFDFDDQARIARRGTNRNLASANFSGKPVLQGVLDNGLQKHAGNKSVERGLLDLLVNPKIVSTETCDLDIEIIIDEVEFLLQRHKGLMLSQQSPQNIAQFDDHAASGVRIVANQ